MNGKEVLLTAGIALGVNLVVLGSTMIVKAVAKNAREKKNGQTGTN